MLKIRDFRYLWGGQVISSLGDSMTSMALMLLVNHLTGSSAALATMMILLAMGAAGILADVMGARNVFILSGVIVVLAGIVAAFIFRGQLQDPEPNLEVPA